MIQNLENIFGHFFDFFFLYHIFFNRHIWMPKLWYFPFPKPIFSQGMYLINKNEKKNFSHIKLLLILLWTFCGKFVAKNMFSAGIKS